MTNLDEMTARLQKLALLPKEVLEQSTVKELRGYLIGLSKGLERLKKADLIAKILELTEPIKEAKRLEVLRLESSQKLEVEKDTCLDMLNEDYILEQYDLSVDGYQLGLDIFKYGSSLGLASTTLAKTWSKRLRQSLDNLVTNNQITELWKNEIYNGYREQAKILDHTYNQKHFEMREKRYDIEEKKTLDGNIIIEYALSILTYSNPKQWGKISLALAITSGRRMDELHGTCDFYYKDESHIQAIGLSKKEDNDTSLEFRTLIDARLWLDAYNLIPTDKIGHNQKYINSIIRKTIENHINLDLETLNFKSYKDARDFYALYMLNHHYEGGIEDSIKFVRDCLGHEATTQSLTYTKFTLKK